MTYTMQQSVHSVQRPVGGATRVVASGLESTSVVCDTPFTEAQRRSSDARWGCGRWVGLDRWLVGG